MQLGRHLLERQFILAVANKLFELDSKFSGSHWLFHHLADLLITGFADGMPVVVSRAPGLTLWGAVVAERLGHPADTAAIFGQALGGSAARVKARLIGREERASDRGMRPCRDCLCNA